MGWLWWPLGWYVFGVGFLLTAEAWDTWVRPTGAHDMTLRDLVVWSTLGPILALILGLILLGESKTLQRLGKIKIKFTR